MGFNENSFKSSVNVGSQEYKNGKRTTKTADTTHTDEDSTTNEKELEDLGVSLLTQAESDLASHPGVDSGAMIIEMEKHMKNALEKSLNQEIGKDKARLQQIKTAVREKYIATAKANSENSPTIDGRKNSVYNTLNYIPGININYQADKNKIKNIHALAKEAEKKGDTDFKDSDKIFISDAKGMFLMGAIDSVMAIGELVETIVRLISKGSNSPEIQAFKTMLQQAGVTDIASGTAGFIKDMIRQIVKDAGQVLTVLNGVESKYDAYRSGEAIFNTATNLPIFKILKGLKTSGAAALKAAKNTGKKIGRHSLQLPQNKTVLMLDAHESSLIINKNHNNLPAKKISNDKIIDIKSRGHSLKEIFTPSPKRATGSGSLPDVIANRTAQTLMDEYYANKNPQLVDPLQNSGEKAPADTELPENISGETVANEIVKSFDSARGALAGTLCDAGSVDCIKDATTTYIRSLQHKTGVVSGIGMASPSGNYDKNVELATSRHAEFIKAVNDEIYIKNPEGGIDTDENGNITAAKKLGYEGLTILSEEHINVYQPGSPEYQTMEKTHKDSKGNRDKQALKKYQGVATIFVEQGGKQSINDKETTEIMPLTTMQQELTKLVNTSYSTTLSDDASKLTINPKQSLVYSKAKGVDANQNNEGGRDLRAEGQKFTSLRAGKEGGTKLKEGGLLSTMPEITVPVDTQTLTYTDSVGEQGTIYFTKNSEGKDGFFVQCAGGNTTFYSFDATSKPAIVMKKPVIYLYPTTTTDISVGLTLTDAHVISEYPMRNKETGRWHVTATPDGRLRDDHGKSYPYLFREANNYAGFQFDNARSMTVTRDDLIPTLEQILMHLGLSDTESADFITYWLPSLQSHDVVRLQFLTDEYIARAVLDVSPVPETSIRLFMIRSSSDAMVTDTSAISLLPSINRTGYTLVERGGAQL